MAAIRILEDQTLRAICCVLGDTNEGLTGTQIGQLLEECGIFNISPTATKRDRLFAALRERQRQDNCGNNVVAFIQAAMNPVRYVRNSNHFEDTRAEVNKVLAFSGLTLGEDGKLRVALAAHTLAEAVQRANRLRKELQSRNVHPDVLRFCRTELLQNNYSHAVFEATKSVADKIRQKANLTSDGSKLVDDAFGKASGLPLLAFNSLQTESEQSEHAGLMNLVKGLFGAFRNITAHEPKIKWSIPEQDALDMLSLASFLHRRLDQAVRTR
jgi:uncharacterized protein (TIGR02391 family)